MMSGEDKVREARLRRVADRRGLRLVKSRRRDPCALTYGRYFVYAQDGTIPDGYQTTRGFTLDEVEGMLKPGFLGEAVTAQAANGETISGQAAGALDRDPVILNRRMFSDDLIRDLGGDPEAQGLS